ncbi:MAG TPA: alkaline phosphatase family protein [Vicinamibacterales bacterium]|nr:alkaline phosphatase family protein [Vicinamibacterales bacterium]
MPHLIRRRALPLAAVCLCAAALVQCSGPRTTHPVKRAAQRVFVLGFDGMDPTLARRWMDEGKLPNLKKLADEGTFRTLGSTQPSESPTAWSSFATGVNPGKHNIYDFLIRDFQTYAPDFNMVRREPPEFLWGFIPTKRPKVLSTRGGTSFWVSAGLDGIRTTVLTVPVTFPPEPIEHGEMLAGLPLPDIRATLGTYYYWATDLSRYEEGNTEFGGILKRLIFEGDTATTELVGPPNPIVRQQLREARAKSPLSESDRARIAKLQADEDIRLPMTVRWDRAAKAATIDIDGTSVRLQEGQWSGWIDLTFRINFLIRVHGMMQLAVLRAGDELQIIGSPVNMDPRDPPIPISKPDGFAADLADRIGVYRTLGWAEWSDKPLNDGRLDEANFLADANRAMDDREKIIFDRLAHDDWDLFVAAIETTDRVQHMMWRLIDPTHPMYDAALAAKYGDAIEKIYVRADDLVGRIRAKLPPDVVFMVMSDHGFHSFRRGVNLNTWLVQNGYMSFEGQESGKKTLADLFGRGRFFEGVDWSRTKAYAVGLGQIYFNLKGREGQGIVSPGAEYTALQDEIRSKLLQLTDPKDGKPVFRDIYRRDDIYKGEYLRNAPDLQVGFNDGYRVGWQDTLGGVTRSVIEDNDRKWSGDHCATATEISGGVFFINRRLGAEHPSIMDLAPTVLKLLGVPLPSDYDGRPLI